jgi:hypothetical protein
MEDQIIVNGNPNEIAGFLLSLEIWKSSNFSIYIYDSLRNSEIITEKTSLVVAEISWLKEDENFSGVFNVIRILKIIIQKIPFDNSIIKFQPRNKDDFETPWDEIRELIIEKLDSQNWLIEHLNSSTANQEKIKTTQVITLQTKPAGRPTYINHDKAYKYYLDNHSEIETFKYWCELEKIENPDKNERRRFKEALNNRIKKKIKK